MLPTYRSALALLSLRRFCLALMLSGATLSAGLGSSPASAIFADSGNNGVDVSYR